MRRSTVQVCCFCLVLLFFLFSGTSIIIASSTSVQAQQIHSPKHLSPQLTVTSTTTQAPLKAQPLLPAPFGFILGILLLLIAVAGSIGITLLLTKRRRL